MGDPPPVTDEEFRRFCDFLYRRTGMVFTEAKRYYVERRIQERIGATGAASFTDLFRPPAQRFQRRGREVRQRLHRQRDLFLPRRPSAALPAAPTCWPRRVRGEAARRAAADLVGAVLDRRRALFDRDVAAGELARGRCPRHRDRRLRHRYPGAGRGAAGRFRQAGADAAVAGPDREIFRAVGRRELADHPDDLRQSVRFSRGEPRGPRPRCARMAGSM